MKLIKYWPKIDFNLNHYVVYCCTLTYYKTKGCRIEKSRDKISQSFRIVNYLFIFLYSGKTSYFHSEQKDYLYVLVLEIGKWSADWIYKWVMILYEFYGCWAEVMTAFVWFRLPRNVSSLMLSVDFQRNWAWKNFL